MDDFDNRIFKFYEYLEYRLKLENENERQKLSEITSTPKKIFIKREKKQPIPSSI